MLIIYQLIISLLLLISPLIIFYRISKNKEDPKRYRERYGISKLKRPKGNLIWIHAASVGEFNSATGLIKYLLKKNNVFNCPPQLSEDRKVKFTYLRTPEGAFLELVEELN